MTKFQSSFFKLKRITRYMYISLLSSRIRIHIGDHMQSWSQLQAANSLHDGSYAPLLFICACLQHVQNHVNPSLRTICSFSVLATTHLCLMWLPVVTQARCHPGSNFLFTYKRYSHFFQVCIRRITFPSCIRNAVQIDGNLNFVNKVDQILKISLSYKSQQLLQL